jgi:ribonuclease Z
MFELVFLGTSASRPTAERGLPALMVLHASERFLVDCGEGTQRQLVRAGLGFRRLGRIFLTHAHLDHVLGLAGLVASLAETPARETITIHGSAPALEVAKRLVDAVLPETDEAVELRFDRIEVGKPIACRSLRVLPVPVVHRGGGSFGFLFEEPGHRRFDAAKAQALGIPPGTERHRLQAGETASLADGRVVRPDEVLGPPEPGLRLLVIGDTAEIDNLLPHAAGVDGLVIEATFLSRERDKARQYGHITAAEAATLAREAGVGALILSHISARYAGPEILAEARGIFPHAQLASDLARFKVTKAN